jgi:hypothetical protein
MHNAGTKRGQLDDKLLLDLKHMCRKLRTLPCLQSAPHFFIYDGYVNVRLCVVFLCSPCLRSPGGNSSSTPAAIGSSVGTEAGASPGMLDGEQQQDLTQDCVALLAELAAAARQHDMGSSTLLVQHDTTVAVSGEAAASHSSGASDVLNSLPTPADTNVAPLPHHVANTSCSSATLAAAGAAADAVASTSMVPSRGVNLTADGVALFAELVAQQHNIRSCTTLAQHGTSVGISGAVAASHTSSASDEPAAADEAVASTSMLRSCRPEAAAHYAAEAVATDQQEQRGMGDNTR